MLFKFALSHPQMEQKNMLEASQTLNILQNIKNLCFLEKVQKALTFLLIQFSSTKKFILRHFFSSYFNFLLFSRRNLIEHKSEKHLFIQHTLQTHSHVEREQGAEKKYHQRLCAEIERKYALPFIDFISMIAFMSRSCRKITFKEHGMAHT